MANLFDISSRFKNLAELVESGEVSPEVMEEALESVEGELTEKLQNITYIIRNNESDIATIDEEIKRLQARKKSLTGNIDRLKTYMLDCMKIADVKKINTSLNTWSIAKNPASVNITDESLLPKEYIITEVVNKVDKKAILTVLKDGIEIKGAELKQGERLAIK